VTGIDLTAVALILAFVTAEARHTRADMPIVSASTGAAVPAWIISTKVLLHFAVSTHPSGLAVTPIVVDELAAVGCAMPGAKVQQALVDIAFTTRPSKARRTATLETTNLVVAHTTVVTDPRIALVLVHLAQLAGCTRRTGAGKTVDQIIAYSAISAWIRLAVVNIVLTLRSHVARCTSAGKVSFLVIARRPVQTRIGGTSVGLVLTVGAPVSVSTVTGMRGAYVSTAATILAQTRNRRAAIVSCNLA